MNRSYGQYGNWNGGSLGYSAAAQAVLNQQGMTVTGPNDDVAAGRQALVGSGISAGSSLVQGAAGSGRGGQALASGVKATAGAASIATTVGPMLVAAGVVNAIPVAGQIAAVGIAVTAGVIALVVSLRKGHMTKAQAKALVAKYGLSDDDLPHYTIRVMRMKDAKRKIKLAKLRRKYKKMTKKRKGLGKVTGRVTTIGRSKKRVKEKMEILATVIAFDRAESKKKNAEALAKAEAAPVIADASIGDQISAQLSDIGIEPQYRLPLGLGLGALVLFFLFRRGA